MAFSKQDKALIESSALIGYCRSATDMVDAPKDRRQAWADGLIELAEEVAKKIDATHETVLTNEQSK